MHPISRYVSQGSFIERIYRLHLPSVHLQFICWENQIQISYQDSQVLDFVAPCYVISPCYVLTCSSVSFVFYKLVVRSRSWIRLGFHFLARTLHTFPSEVHLILCYWCKATNWPPLSLFLVLDTEASLLIFLTLDLYCPLPWGWDSSWSWENLSEAKSTCSQKDLFSLPVQDRWWWYHHSSVMHAGVKELWPL